MRMRLSFIIIVCIGIMCGGVTVFAETLQVDSISPDGAWTSVLDSGKLYLFEVSGMWLSSIYNYNTWGKGEADAEWFHLGAFSPSDPWIEVLPQYSYSQDVTDLLMDDISVDWLGSVDGINWDPHVFSPNHVYRYYYTGNGMPVHLYISDHTPYGGWMYWDNAGSLFVNVEPVPEPSTFILLVAGLAGVGLLRRRIIN